MDNLHFLTVLIKNVDKIFKVIHTILVYIIFFCNKNRKHLEYSEKVCYNDNKIKKRVLFLINIY